MSSTTRLWEDLENYPNCLLFTWVEDGQDAITVALQKPCSFKEAEERAIKVCEGRLQQLSTLSSMLLPTAGR